MLFKSPTIYILVPSMLKAMPKGSVSSVATLKLIESYEAVERFQPVDKVYWKTVLFKVPTIYILVPSMLKAMP